MPYLYKNFTMPDKKLFNETDHTAARVVWGDIVTVQGKA